MSKKSGNIISEIEDFAGSAVNHTDGNSVFIVPELFDSLVRDHGVLLEHFIALPCPQSDKNINNIRSNHVDHNCDNGFYYSCAGTFLGIMTSNSKNNRFQAEGIIDSSTCYIIVPRFYEKNGETVYFSPYDKIYVADRQYKEVLVPNFETVEASTTGVDRLRFPACKVTHIIDKNGQPSYAKDIDYTVGKDGNIQWLSQNRPQFNAVLQEGGVYAVRYLYRPYFYIASVEHEIRLAKVLDNETDDKTVVRLPQYIRCIRERYFRDAEQSDQANNPRETFVPASGKNLPWR